MQEEFIVSISIKFHKKLLPTFKFPFIRVPLTLIRKLRYYILTLTFKYPNHFLNLKIVSKFSAMLVQTRAFCSSFVTLHTVAGDLKKHHDKHKKEFG